MSRPLRLLLAAQPLDGGVAHHVVDVVDGLAPDRFEIDVACPRRSVTWTALQGRPNVRLTEISAARRPAPADAASLARLTRLVRRADVVHAHSAKAGYLARLAALPTRRTGRVAFSPHAWSFWAGSGAERAVYLLLERLAAHWCATIVAVSEAERDAGLAAGVGSDRQYAVIPNGIALERYGAEPDPIPGRAVMVGGLRDQKRPDLAIRAIVAVRATVPNAELVIVGDGPRRAELEALASGLGAGDAVRFLGTRHDVADILRTASVLVLATRYESWPLTLMEGMAAGAPVVATGVGGIPEIVDDGRTGLLTRPDDLEGLTSALRSLLEDEDRARSMGAEARSEAHRRFGRGAMQVSLAALYERLAAAGRRDSPAPS